MWSHSGLLTWTILHYTLSEIVEVGNSWSDSTQGLSNVRKIAFLLIDFSLLNGTLREFRFTTTDNIAPLRLQVWRPQSTTSNTGQPQYTLVKESTYFSDDVANNSIYPGDGSIVQEGDILGFLSESDDSGVVYDFRPLGFGAHIRTRSFSTLPRVNRTYNFDAIAYDTWVFAMSALVDTNYGTGPLNGGLSKPTTKTTTTTALPVIRIGNPLIYGDSLKDTPGTLILDGERYNLKEGHVTQLNLYSTMGNITIWLQIWRPLQGGRFLLCDERRHTTSSIGIETVTFKYPMQCKPGDKLGFTCLDPFFPIAYNSSASYSLVHYRSAIGSNYTTFAKPQMNRIYDFNESLYNCTFSFSVLLDTDISKYKPPPERPGPAFVSKAGLTKEGSTLLGLIIILYLIIIIIATIYAVWFIVNRNRRVDLVSKSTKSIVVHSPPEWSIPRTNIYVYEKVAESHTCLILKAEVYGIGTKQGWTTASVRTLKELVSDEEKHSFLREMEVMRSIKNNANVLQMLGCCVEKDPLMMVMEAVLFGSLLDYLRDLKHTHIHMNIAGHSNFTLTMDLINFAAQIARAMAYLASLRILHKDLAARSVFLGEGKLCKVTFFSYAQDVVGHRQYQRALNERIPLRWMALESITSNIYTSKSDVWSFGILLWEIVTLGATPYHDMEGQKVIKYIKRGSRLEKPPHCRDELYDIMASCWRAKALDRPSFDVLSGALQHLHDRNTDLLQLEKYPDATYDYILPNNDSDEIV